MSFVQKTQWLNLMISTKIKTAPSVDEEHTLIWIVAANNSFREEVKLKFSHIELAECRALPCLFKGTSIVKYCQWKNARVTVMAGQFKKQGKARHSTSSVRINIRFRAHSLLVCLMSDKWHHKKVFAWKNLTYKHCAILWLIESSGITGRGLGDLGLHFPNIQKILYPLSLHPPPSRKFNFPFISFPFHFS